MFPTLNALNNNNNLVSLFSRTEHQTNNFAKGPLHIDDDVLQHER